MQAEETARERLAAATADRSAAVEERSAALEERDAARAQMETLRASLMEAQEDEAVGVSREDSESGMSGRRREATEEAEAAAERQQV